MLVTRLALPCPPKSPIPTRRRAGLASVEPIRGAHILVVPQLQFRKLRSGPAGLRAITRCHSSQNGERINPTYECGDGKLAGPSAPAALDERGVVASHHGLDRGRIPAGLATGGGDTVGHQPLGDRLEGSALTAFGDDPAGDLRR